MTNVTSNFDGAVHDDARADIGTNREGERVVRIDLTYRRGTAAIDNTMILSVEAAIALRNLLNGVFDAAGIDDGPEPTDVVSPGCGCPKCGEARQDHLAWDEDGVKVRCSTCGTTYQPEGH